jgi:hypothetical protein
MGAYDNYPPGLVPIGGVVAWMKSLAVATGYPALALSSEFVECNGQVLADPESPWNGKTIPNLNGASAGTKRFLRGSATSGTTGGTETHTHPLTLYGTSTTLGTGTSNYIVRSGSSSYNTDAAATLPSYYEVVWVFRIK